MPPRASGRCAGGADARRCRGFQGPFAQRSDRAAPCRRAGMNAYGSVVRHCRQRRRARSPPCRVQRCTASRRAAAAALRPMPPDRHCRAADASAPFARRNALPPRLHGSRAERPRPTVPQRPPTPPEPARRRQPNLPTPRQIHCMTVKCAMGTRAGMAATSGGRMDTYERTAPTPPLSWTPSRSGNPSAPAQPCPFHAHES